MGFGFSASGTGGGRATAREGPTEHLTKPSRHRAEKDKTRGVFFLFLFLLYFLGVGKVS